MVKFEYRFYTDMEYRKFIRNIPPGIKFETASKPFEIPIVLLVYFKENLYF